MDIEQEISINNDLQPDWNKDIVEDVKAKYEPDLVINPRDWTIETIVSQISSGNIDLEPKYQRRNVWNDKRRSMLIESLILGVPVPEIILAEDKGKKRAFIVIDGKQRLLTLAGFIRPKDKTTWSSAKLTGLDVLTDLNGLRFEDLNEDSKRQLINASIRCSFITNYRTDDLLYDIFYRLNTGSVPLSTQELRQVLNRGHFANYLIEVTNQENQPLHRVMNLTEPDVRLRDAEMLLRLIVFTLFAEKYRGNLKNFLDINMGKVNKEWNEYEQIVRKLYIRLNNAINLLIDLFETPKRVGRKWTRDGYESRFNRVLFEVQVYYFLDITPEQISKKQNNDFLVNFKELNLDPEFRSSIESSTKNIESYKIRYGKFRELMRTVFNIESQINPFENIKL